MSRKARGRAATTLVVLASVAIVLALAAGYVRHAAVDSDQFANRATVALRDDSVRTLIAERITDRVVLAHAGDLLAARPIIESVTSAVVGSRAFAGLFRSAVRDAHRGIFHRDQNTVTLTVKDVGTVVAAGLEALRPSLARKVERIGRVKLIRRDIGTASATAARAAETVTVLAWGLLVVALVLAAGALALSPDRRRTSVQLGVGVAVGGALVVVACAIGRSVALDQLAVPEERAAAGAVWDAFLTDLRTAGWILAASGAIVAASAASLIRPVDIGEPLRVAARAIAREPARPALRVLRGVVLVAAGVIVLVARDAVVWLLLTVTAIYLVYAGVSAVLRVVYKPRPAHAEPVVDEPPPRRRAFAMAAMAAVLIAVAALAFLGSGGVTTAAPAPGPCEGHDVLCDRPLDEVALPATHNSMSVPLPGWFAAEQDRPIAAQLRDGVRGLLIDTHYADRLPNGRLRTELEDRPAKLPDSVSPKAVDAALRLRDRLGFSGKGERGMYLCHTFCELGGTPLASVLDDLHDFLVANPGAVVVVINQDYVTPADFVAAVERAGLGDLVYRGPVTGKWPTLREMIDSHQRVVFLAENHAGAADWYHPAYQAITEETPYTFKPGVLNDPARVAATCRANRGPAAAALFLVNHWVSTDPLPRPSDAERVNALTPLLRRVRGCGRIRHHIPNLVAVNFYRRGDLFRVVDELNGVR